jgi:hypothetical protein
MRFVSRLAFFAAFGGLLSTHVYAEDTLRLNIAANSSTESNVDDDADLGDGDDTELVRWRRGYCGHHHSRFVVRSYGGYYRPSYYSYYRPAYATYYRAPVYYSYYTPCALPAVVSAAPITIAPQPQLSETPTQLPQPQVAPQPIPKGGLPYDGGPKAPVPMPPSDESAPVNPSKAKKPATSTDRFVSLEIKPKVGATEKKRLTYSAYGEKK